MLSLVLRVEALPSGIVLGGQTQSLREFQEWAVAGALVHTHIKREKGCYYDGDYRFGQLSSFQLETLIQPPCIPGSKYFI